MPVIADDIDETPYLGKLDMPQSHLIEETGSWNLLFELCNFEIIERKKELKPNTRNFAGDMLRHDLSLIYWVKGTPDDDKEGITLPGCVCWRNAMTGELDWSLPLLKGQFNYLKHNICCTFPVQKRAIYAIKAMKWDLRIGQDWLKDPEGTTKAYRKFQASKPPRYGKKKTKADRIVMTGALPKGEK